MPEQTSRITLKIYCQSKGYNRVGPVRINASGYKYVTLLDINNTSLLENLYLGVRYSETVEVDDKLPVNDLWVTEVVNAEGEIRMKLTDKSGVLSAEKAAEYQAI